MTEQAAYHEGYRKALEEVSGLVNNISDAGEQLRSLVQELERKIEKARCLSRSSLASGAGGHQGY